MERTNMLGRAVLGVVAGPAGVAVSFDERLVIWLRVLGLLAGALVSIAMLWSIVATRLERRRWSKAGMERERLKLARERLRLCAECQAGGQPSGGCPVPKHERGTGCRLKV